jgi:hypothetical protein
MNNTIDARITEKLQLSIAMQLVGSFIDAEYTRFCVDASQFSEEELDNLLRAIRFYQNTTGKKKGCEGSVGYEIEKRA